MESRKLPGLLAVGGIVLAIVLFVVLRDNDGDGGREPAEVAAVAQDSNDEPKKPKPKPKREKPDIAAIEVEDAEPVGGVQKLEFDSGSEILVEVTSDVDDELHLHGYDVYLDLKASRPATLEVPADIEGRFELESHTTGVVLAEISVVPA